MLFKIIAVIVLIGIPVGLFIWMLCVHAAHQGKMAAYDRLAETFRKARDD